MQRIVQIIVLAFGACLLAACTDKQSDVVIPPHSIANEHENAEAVSNQFKRPLIWVTAEQRADILEQIDNNEWANSLFLSLKERADKAVSKISILMWLRRFLKIM